MKRQIVTSGLLAGLVGILWTVVALGLVPFRDSMGWKETPNEDLLLPLLDGNLTEEGLYLLPGHSPPDSLFRARHDEGPFFRVHSLPRGTEGPIRSLISILSLLVAPLIPAWFLAALCRSGSPGFGARVGAVSLFGLFLALTANIQLWGMELYPLAYSLLLSANGILSWVVIGLFLAWRIKPDSGRRQATS